LPHDWGTNFQPSVTPVMDQIESFHRVVLYIVTAVCIFVLVLLVWIILRYNQRANPVPSKVSHNTFLEIIWTAVPALILGTIAIPSSKLPNSEMTLPKAAMTLRASGKKWLRTYQSTAPGGGTFPFDSLGLTENKAKAAGEPRLLGVDNPVVLLVNKNVIVET